MFCKYRKRWLPCAGIVATHLSATRGLSSCFPLGAAPFLLDLHLFEGPGLCIATPGYHCTAFPFSAGSVQDEQCHMVLMTGAPIATCHSVKCHQWYLYCWWRSTGLNVIYLLSNGRNYKPKNIVIGQRACPQYFQLFIAVTAHHLS